MALGHQVGGGSGNRSPRLGRGVDGSGQGGAQWVGCPSAARGSQQPHGRGSAIGGLAVQLQGHSVELLVDEDSGGAVGQGRGGRVDHPAAGVGYLHRARIPGDRPALGEGFVGVAEDESDVGRYLPQLGFHLLVQRAFQVGP